MNAKNELIIEIEGIGKRIKEAVIWTEDYSYNKKYFILKENYTEEQYINFLNSLDFEYDDGFGGQELYGYVIFTDDTWLDRGEYDGSEWWNYNETPNIKKLFEEDE